MKKIGLLIGLFGLTLLSSCNGIQKVNEFYFDTIYIDERITIKVDDVEWNPGLSKVGGAEIRTTKSKQLFIQLLEEQGVNFLEEEDDILSHISLFQINHRGLWSIEFDCNKTYMQVLIREMSIWIKNGIYFPFPLYGIFKDVLLDEIYLNETYKNVDEEYIYQSLLHFNELVNVYSNIEKNHNEVNLFYQKYELTLTFNEEKLSFKLNEI